MYAKIYFEINDSICSLACVVLEELVNLPSHVCGYRTSYLYLFNVDSFVQVIKFISLPTISHLNLSLSSARTEMYFYEKIKKHHKKMFDLECLTSICKIYAKSAIQYLYYDDVHKKFIFFCSACLLYKHQSSNVVFSQFLSKKNYKKYLTSNIMVISRKRK